MIFLPYLIVNAHSQGTIPMYYYDRDSSFSALTRGDEGNERLRSRATLRCARGIRSGNGNTRRRACDMTCCGWSEAAQAAVRDTTNISTKAYKKYGSRSRKDGLFLCAGNIACAASGM